MSADPKVGSRVLDHLSGRRSRMVELLVQLAGFESPSLIPDAQTDVLHALRDALTGIGYRVRSIPGRRTGGHLLAVPEPRRGPIQLLIGHCDTVWPLGTIDDMPVAVRDGEVRGPGVYDMKAGLVQAIFALRALRALELWPGVAPVVFVNSDEEIGSPESSRHLRRLARVADRAFVLEPSLGPEGKLKTRRKGVGRFQITIRGTAAHAGLDPDEGVSAILELSHVVQRLFDLNDPERGVSVNVGTIEGGLRPNVVAPVSRADVDVRAWTLEDAERIEGEIRGLEPVVPGTSLSIEGGFGRPPMERSEATARLWRRARAAADTLGLELAEGGAGGGSDGNHVWRLTPTLDGLGAVGGGAHQAGEHVRIDAMVERSALLALLLLEPALVPAGEGEGSS